MDSCIPLTNLVDAAISFLTLFATNLFIRRSRSHQENKTVASLTLLDPPSSLPHNWIHHVFPSFHGEDVRTNFLSHIVKEFRSKGIDLFIDNDIERSMSIGSELIEAIRGSRIAIVLLSVNYGSSTWCLNELVEIIKCREEFGQTVMSLFYEVDPTDVKKQTGDFGKVFRKTCKGEKKEVIQRWKHALKEVAQIAGFHSTNWENEAEMIEAIATDVSNKLNLSAPSNDFDGLVGMESHMSRMGLLLQLDSDEVRKIGIWGPPGIGKTTIARSLFNKYSQDFQMSVFVDNIKRKYVVPSCSDDYSVKLDFQKQFMSQLTNEKDINIPHLGVVKDRLKDKKVLVVLDDVDRLVQLEAMAKETSWFGPGSRIIITSQDQKVLKASGINHIHKVQLPSDYEALQIFCMHAFGQKKPKDGFKKLACEVRWLVGKLPLGLKVMGSYFRGMSETDWTEALPRLRTHLDRDGDIASILKFSYNALHDEDKSLFLYIACFFKSEPFGIVEGCLADCFVDVTLGIRVLVEKSLISIGDYEEEERIYMAELLVQLGRKIVREESISEPWKRKFLHDANDIGEALSDDKAGNSSVIGINLQWDEEITWTSERAFELFSNFQFLKFESNHFNPRSLKYISRKHRVLIWIYSPMLCFPSSFNPELLVKLEMKWSKLVKLWEGIKPLSNLRWIDLSNSKSLEELPDLSTATNLQDLNLNGCFSLVALPFSIGNATNLQKLNLKYCRSLVNLPSSMKNLCRLSRLELEECSMLEVVLANINLESLRYLNLSGCSSFKSYHESSTDIQELVDPWSGRISRLHTLELRRIKKLVLLSPLPDSLWELDASSCESQESLDCSFPDPYRLVNFANCFKLNQEARDLIIQSSSDAVFPAGEVPQCFTYRSSGNSLTVKLNQMPLDTSTKFKVCILRSTDEDDERFSNWQQFYVRCIITSGGIELNWSSKWITGVFRGNLFIFESGFKTEKLTSTEVVFEFCIAYVDRHGGRTTSERLKIKECGAFQFPEVPLLSFRDVHEDFEPSDDGSSKDSDEDYETSDDEI